jgi:hypothetical protein
MKRERLDFGLDFVDWQKASRRLLFYSGKEILLLEMIL